MLLHIIANAAPAIVAKQTKYMKTIKLFMLLVEIELYCEVLQYHGDLQH